MELNLDSFVTPKGVLSVLAALAVVCSFILSVPVIGQQLAVAPSGGQAGGTLPIGTGPVSIPGLEGLNGFVAGENQISLATYMVSQDGDKLYFQVVGLALSNPDSQESTVYTMIRPLNGVLDRSVNTIQIDMSDIASSVGSAGTVDKSTLYDALRSNKDVFIIDLDAVYSGPADGRATFDVNSVTLIKPDGTRDLFSLDQPMQLAIDTMTYRMSFPAFPELTSDMYDCYDNYAAGGYTSVAPVAYPVAVPVATPVLVPVYIPVPIPVAPCASPLYGGYGGYGDYGGYGGYGGYGDYGGYGGCGNPYGIAPGYYRNTFTPGICENQFGLAAAAASAAACGVNPYDTINGLSPYICGGGGAAAAAAAAASSAGVDYGGIAAAASAAAAASSGYNVASATASTAAATGGWGSASAAAAAAAAAASGGADFGGAATAAAAAAAAASGGGVSATATAVATAVGGAGASAAAAAAASAASGGADFGGVAASAAAAAAAASNGDPLAAVQHFHGGGFDTPGSRAALDAARSARLAGDDPPAISGKIKDAAAHERSSGHVATPTPKVKPASVPYGKKTDSGAGNPAPGGRNGKASLSPALTAKKGAATVPATSLKPGIRASGASPVPGKTNSGKNLASPSPAAKPGAIKSTGTTPESTARLKATGQPTIAPRTNSDDKAATNGGSKAALTPAKTANTAPKTQPAVTSTPKPTTKKGSATLGPQVTVKPTVLPQRTQMQTGSNAAITPKPVTKTASGGANPQAQRTVTNAGKTSVPDTTKTVSQPKTQTPAKSAPASQTKAVQPATTKTVSQPKTQTAPAKSAPATQTKAVQPATTKTVSLPKTQTPAKSAPATQMNTISQPKTQSTPKTTAPVKTTTASKPQAQSKPAQKAAPAVQTKTPQPTAHK